MPILYGSAGFGVRDGLEDDDGHLAASSKFLYKEWARRKVGAASRCRKGRTGPSLAGRLKPFVEVLVVAYGDLSWLDAMIYSNCEEERRELSYQNLGLPGEISVPICERQSGYGAHSRYSRCWRRMLTSCTKP